MVYRQDESGSEFAEEKALLMRAMLLHAGHLGWSWRALDLAAEDCGVSDARMIFADATPCDFVVAAYDMAEEVFRQDLLEAQDDWAKLRVREKIAAGVRMRLHPWRAHRSALKSATAILLYPWHARRAARCCYGTLDKIWRAAGDRSVDFSFYSKRATLSGVYLSTLLFWLEDESEDSHESWAFLDRRIGEALQIGGSFAKSRGKAAARAKGCAQKAQHAAGMVWGSLFRGALRAKP